jgi:alkylation response protein AidB-like acyl-CoA dehydrogenase
MSTAGSERGLNLRSPARYSEVANRLVHLFEEQRRKTPKKNRAGDDVARAVLRAEAYAIYTYWTVSSATPTTNASCNKIFWSETDVQLHKAALSLLGVDAQRLDTEWMDGYLFALAGPIYAGTNEIQRNVIAERLLGLPR